MTYDHEQQWINVYRVLARYRSADVVLRTISDLGALRGTGLSLARDDTGAWILKKDDDAKATSAEAPDRHQP